MWTTRAAPTRGTGDGIGGSCPKMSVNRIADSVNVVSSWKDDTTMPLRPAHEGAGQTDVRRGGALRPTRQDRRPVEQRDRDGR